MEWKAKWRWSNQSGELCAICGVDIACPPTVPINQYNNYFPTCWDAPVKSDIWTREFCDSHLSLLAAMLHVRSCCCASDLFLNTEPTLTSAYFAEAHLSDFVWRLDLRTVVVYVGTPMVLAWEFRNTVRCLTVLLQSDDKYSQSNIFGTLVVGSHPPWFLMPLFISVHSLFQLRLRCHFFLKKTLSSCFLNCDPINSSLVQRQLTATGALFRH